MDKYLLYTALITPYLNGKINCNNLKQLIETQIEHGVDGLVIGGTTGLGSIYQEDLLFIAQKAIEFAKKRIKIVIGIAEYKYKKVTSLIKNLNKLEIDGYLVLTPYYLTVSQEDLFYYYQKINSLSKHPIIIYHVPNRTGQKFLPDTMVKCLKLKNIIGIKLASFDLEMIKILKNKTKDKLIFLGNDEKIDLINQGFDGIISVFSNLNPSLMKEALFNNEKQEKLINFFKKFNQYPNPSGIISLMNEQKKFTELPFPYHKINRKFKEIINLYQNLILQTSEIVIIGKGRLGNKINESLKQYQPIQIDVRQMSEYKKEKLSNAKIIIDFSHPDSVKTYEKLNFLNHPCFIIGTTGFQKLENIHMLSKKYPVLYDVNFSIGITQLKYYLKMINKNNNLNNYNAHLLEIHHQNKKDIPSGTLLMLKETLNRNCKIQCKRIANIKGIHMIKLENENEKIILSHYLKDLNAIIEGLIIGLNFIIFKNSGLYNMEEVIFNGND